MSTSATADFERLALGDRRLDERGRKIVAALSARPAVGAPTVLTPAELEGYYRFVNNDRVTFEALLSAHADASVARAAGRPRVVVAHDTTDFRFADEVPREGLGPMDNGGQGFYAHFSLAVAAPRHAFGVVAVSTWTRTAATGIKKKQKERYEDPAKESLRWMRSVRDAEARFDAGTRLVHVMDCEADDYDILCELVQSGRGFVVRASYDRRLASHDADADEPLHQHVKAFVRELAVRCHRDVDLSSRRKNRPAKQRKTHPPRDARDAKLAFAAQTVTLRRPDRSKAPLRELSVNVVHAYELSPPAGCEAVEWFLYTMEPIDSDEAILQIVDDYRSRWAIEEFFKAIKTGCAFEKRQHETMRALLNALGIYIPIAWALLNARTLSRDEASAHRPAEEVFNAVQLEILRRESKGRLGNAPTIRDAVWTMARFLGGLQPSNGAPGWHVLGRAFEKLLALEAGWRLAVETFGILPARSDR